MAAKYTQVGSQNQIGHVKAKLKCPTTGKVKMS